MSRRTKRGVVWAGLLLSLLGAQRLEAVEVVLSARFDGNGPAQWVHTTPPASNCLVVLSLCRYNRLSVQVPVSYRKWVVMDTAMPRANFYGTMPGPRTGWVAHEQTGERFEIQLSFNAYSQAVDHPERDVNPANTGYRMNGSNCQPQNPQFRSPTTVVTHWNYYEFPGRCFTRSIHVQDRPGFVDVSDMALAYTLTLPPTFRLKPGRYRGSIDYRLGDGGDFDFGEGVTELSDTTATFTIVLDVEHEFRVEFGANFEQATLEPPGGWASWLDGGRVPPKIASDKSLRLWSSGPFRVYKQCQFEAGAHCAIRNRRGEEVPLQVMVSMPWGIRYAGWQGVNRMLLPTGRDAALDLEATVRTSNGPGQVHFEVGEADLKPMLDRAGERYSGTVTLLFDADI